MARKTTSATRKIMAYIERNPDDKPAHVAKALKVPVARVYSVRAKLKQEARDAAQFNAFVVEWDKPVVKKGFWATVVGWFK